MHIESLIEEWKTTAGFSAQSGRVNNTTIEVDIDTNGQITVKNEKTGLCQFDLTSNLEDMANALAFGMDLPETPIKIMVKIDGQGKVTVSKS